VSPGTEDRAEFFRKEILEWGVANHRDYAWRATRDPFRVLVAEMMLRRTRADQVSPVYETFMNRVPDARTLATVPEEEIRILLQPLGLAWRVPAFQQMARRIVEDYGGTVPRDREALISLPGVGDYVADAVRCLTGDEPVALVDANTVRVAGRYFGFRVTPESRRRKDVKQAISRLVDPSKPRESNLALLDFAAAICRAGRPSHHNCPVASRCAFWLDELAIRRGGTTDKDGV
jgi:A/G-specific adenine glycosylase